MLCGYMINNCPWYVEVKIQLMYVYQKILLKTLQEFFNFFYLGRLWPGHNKRYVHKALHLIEYNNSAAALLLYSIKCLQTYLNILPFYLKIDFKKPFKHSWNNFNNTILHTILLLHKLCNVFKNSHAILNKENQKIIRKKHLILQFLWIIAKKILVFV